MDYPIFVNTDFEYIIRKPKQRRICFGSGQSRDTSRSGARYYTAEDYPNVGPGSYDVSDSFNAVKTRVRTFTSPCQFNIEKALRNLYRSLDLSVDSRALVASVKGVTAVSLDSPNLSFVWKIVHRHPIASLPFLSLLKRRNIHSHLPARERSSISSKIQGTRIILCVNDKIYSLESTLRRFRPGMYVDKKIKGTTFEHSFGGKVKMQLGVDLKCCYRSTDICKICGKTPTGDYWHLNDKIFLCKVCMTKEFQEQAKFKRKKLESFRVSFQHFQFKSPLSLSPSYRHFHRQKIKKKHITKIYQSIINRN